MKTWSFRLAATGEFIGATWQGDPRHLPANTPPGCEAVEGVHEALPDPVAQAREARQRALRRIGSLESAQARPLRELAIDPDNVVARERLRELDARIAALRNALPPPVE